MVRGVLCHAMRLEEPFVGEWRRRDQLRDVAGAERDMEVMDSLGVELSLLRDRPQRAQGDSLPLRRGWRLRA